MTRSTNGSRQPQIHVRVSLLGCCSGFFECSDLVVEGCALFIGCLQSFTTGLQLPQTCSESVGVSRLDLPAQGLRLVGHPLWSFDTQRSEFCLIGSGESGKF